MKERIQFLFLNTIICFCNLQTSNVNCENTPNIKYKKVFKSKLIENLTNRDLINEKTDYVKDLINEDAKIEEKHNLNGIEVLEENPIFNISETTNELTTPWINQKKFCIEYFKNLDKNKIQNIYGNCGYTAIGMYLSYYDTVWDNGVIDIKFHNKNTDDSDCKTYVESLNSFDLDYESPGVFDTKIDMADYCGYLFNADEKRKKTTSYQKEFEKNAWEYALDLSKEKSLFGYMVNLNIESGLIHKKKNWDDDYFDGFSVTYGEVLGTFTNYVNSLKLLRNKIRIFTNKVDKLKVTKKVLRSEIIERLKNGEPVIVGGNGFNIYDEDGNDITDNVDANVDLKSNNYTVDEWGHVCLAYDYDENNDIIYGNAGWGREDNHVNLDKLFNTQISDYYGFEMIEPENFRHVHKHCYHVKGSNDTLCSCKLNSHLHNYVYKSVDTIKHKKRCFCENLAVDEKHEYREKFLNGKFYLCCDECGFLKEETSYPTFMYI